MSGGPEPLPKPASGAFKELWEQLRATLDLPRTVLVLDGALDRKVLEELLGKASRGSLGRPGQMPKPELVGRLVDAFHKSGEVAYALMRELDKSCHKERHIVASIDEASVDERIASYRALDFRRERARLVWALLRDGRGAHRAAADRVLTDAFVQAARAEAEKAALAAASTDASAEAPTDAPTTSAPAPTVLADVKTRLESYERALQVQQQELKRATGQKESIERERSELMARLGARERALRDEEELRRRLEDELTRARDELTAARARLAAIEPARAGDVEGEAARLRDRARALEQKLEAKDAHASSLAALEQRIDEAARAHQADRRAWDKAREAFEEQLRVLAARERAALERLAAVREELHAARRQLAGEAAPAARPLGRVGVFCDAANLSASARRDFGSKLDYRALLEHVVDGRPRACALAFVVHEGEEGAWQGFARSLKDGGWELREKRPKVRADGTHKADWDMGMAVEMLDAQDDLDVIVLCSGDGDFLPLIKRFKRDKLRVEVAAFRASADEALIAAADAFWPLDGRFRLAGA
ncbi:MAG: NYN domain-containing protein [Deltaproteobacteria bacterium]|nr:NYN domain-containing protein [Deltaproteobacteria bacterium]